jgi:hypothetical protein
MHAVGRRIQLRVAATIAPERNIFAEAFQHCSFLLLISKINVRRSAFARQIN